MKVTIKELERINERMKGWEIVEVRSGDKEDVFIFHLQKDKNKRTVILAANDLGGWME